MKDDDIFTHEKNMSQEGGKERKVVEFDVYSKEEREQAALLRPGAETV